jgi:hypothetical protein
VPGVQPNALSPNVSVQRRDTGTPAVPVGAVVEAIMLVPVIQLLDAKSPREIVDGLPSIPMR